MRANVLYFATYFPPESSSSEEIFNIIVNYWVCEKVISLNQQTYYSLEDLPLTM